jgi:hypothetical protein
VVHPTNTYIDTNARYSGTDDPIQYRIRARNVAGNSPGWASDTGYPPLRNIKIFFWCWAQDSSGTLASTTWARAMADYADVNSFWSRYGLNTVCTNPGAFTYITEGGYRNITGSEDVLMHNAHNMPNTLNIYYVDTYEGNYWFAHCYVFDPGANNNLNNVFISDGRDTRGNPPNEFAQALPHEVGHGFARLFDIYLLDTSGDNWRDSTCAAENLWPTSPPLFCDENAYYPEGAVPPGANPKQLMCYAWVGPINEYNLYYTQWLWVDTWVHGYEACYPWP